MRGGHAPSGSQCPSSLLIPAKAIPTRVNRRRAQQYGDAWAVARSEAPIQQGYPFQGPVPPTGHAHGLRGGNTRESVKADQMGGVLTSWEPIGDQTSTSTYLAVPEAMDSY